ncbi:MAG: hypothetical protein ABI767_05855 [Rhodanobacter sp.]
MTNTIELLEAIGKDASLRHASKEDLAQALGGMDASTGLNMAAASGDSRHLAQELGYKDNKVNLNPHNGGCDGDGDDMESEPDQGGNFRDEPSSGDSKP